MGDFYVLRCYKIFFSIHIIIIHQEISKCVDIFNFILRECIIFPSLSTQTTVTNLLLKHHPTVYVTHTTHKLYVFYIYVSTLIKHSGNKTLKSRAKGVNKTPGFSVIKKYYDGIEEKNKSLSVVV